MKEEADPAQGIGQRFGSVQRCARLLNRHRLATALSVLGDWFAQQGDPRGELIGLELAPPTKETKARIRGLILPDTVGSGGTIARRADAEAITEALLTTIRQSGPAEWAHRVRTASEFYDISWMDSGYLELTRRLLQSLPEPRHD